MEFYHETMHKSFLFWLCLLGVYHLSAQEPGSIHLQFKGQAIAYSLFNPGNEQNVWLGARYLPQLNSELQLKQSRLFDFEASANAFANLAFGSHAGTYTDGKLKPYRLWLRYSTPRLEVRAGLQKINFGSASMLRPLMWFDQMDPRDPLKLTDGVWGLLGRYYFMNNANVWLWGLYGNKAAKGWEINITAKGKPELGARLQYPIPLGEAALTYHHRTAAVQNPFLSVVNITETPENRIGLDVRIDWTLGTWFEASWTNLETDFGIYNNQQVFNLGFDYTFDLGSGLYTAFEQLVFAVDEKAFTFTNPVVFSLLSLSYPMGMFDNLSAIFYYDWHNHNIYNFVNYQHQFKQIYLYAMAFWNPDVFNMPAPGGKSNLFSGRGVQLMLVWNH